MLNSSRTSKATLSTSSRCNWETLNFSSSGKEDGNSSTDTVFDVCLSTLLLTTGVDPTVPDEPGELFENPDGFIAAGCTVPW